ncbi:hypothetical protein Acr_19g0005710 [Actinidia rufa]|uniref:Uncharacterized protein n=1 Tax=Actinidia rufa TaxID=165716 RepID=A0A7J0GA10_9ERIC|nr:hypothetical protein Acr_19g0005710 [Actinidia rufa]
MSPSTRAAVWAAAAPVPTSWFFLRQPSSPTAGPPLVRPRSWRLCAGGDPDSWTNSLAALALRKRAQDVLEKSNDAYEAERLLSQGDGRHEASDLKDETIGVTIVAFVMKLSCVCYFSSSPNYEANRRPVVLLTKQVVLPHNGCIDEIKQDHDAIDLKPFGGIHVLYKDRSSVRLVMGNMAEALQDAKEASTLAPKYPESKNSCSKLALAGAYGLYYLEH